MSALTPKQQAMVDVFQKHMDAELAGDIEMTMATMTANPHLHNVTNMMGGVGRDGDWDQATVLVQLGLLDPKGLPVCSAESAEKILSFT